VEVDAKYREVVGLRDLGSAEAKAFRRRAWRRRLSRKPGLKLAVKGASKSAVADFDQPTARRMRPNVVLRQEPTGSVQKLQIALHTKTIPPLPFSPHHAAPGPNTLRARLDFGRRVPRHGLPGLVHTTAVGRLLANPAKRIYTSPRLTVAPFV
jgi:hypothetical protein